MIDALLTTNQAATEDLLACNAIQHVPYKLGYGPTSEEVGHRLRGAWVPRASISTEGTFQTSDLTRPQETPDFVTLSAQRLSLVIPVKAELTQARSTLKELARLGERAGREHQLQQAMSWLSENRQKYAGHWIALQGTRLLATGMAAKEVYSKIKGEQPPPLVVKVETEELPFAGW